MKETLLAVPGDAHQLWPQFMFTFRYRDFDFDQKKILDCVNECVSKQTKDVESGVAPQAKSKGLKESTFDFIQRGDEYPILNKLKMFFEQAVQEVVHHALPHEREEFRLPLGLTTSTVITDSWYHVTNGGGAHAVHTHGGSSWSGIFYVKSRYCDMDTNNGINTWYNQYANTAQADLGSHWWSGSNVTSIPPKEGMLVLFPSWIPHDGSAYSGPEDRVLISFNAIVVPSEDAERMKKRNESK